MKTNTKEKIKPELLPADLGGGNIEFLKRGAYAKRTAENQAILLKVEVTKDTVTGMLEALDKGKMELPSDNPEEYHKIFEIVKVDYEAGVEKVEKDLQEAADKVAKEAQEKADKEKADKDLFLAVKDKTADIGDLSELFETGTMDRCVARPGTTDEQLLKAFNSGLQMESFSGWMLGDLGAELEKRGKTSVVAELVEASGKSYPHIRGLIKTAQTFPPADRVAGVASTIYRELANAKFTKEQEGAKKKVLEGIKKGEYTVQTVREAVKTAQGKEAPEKKAPEEDEKFVFIIVDPQADDIKKNLVQTCVGFPKDLFGNGVVVINPKTQKQFVGFKVKGENRWVALEEYTPAKSPAQQIAEAVKTKGKGNKK